MNQQTDDNPQIDSIGDKFRQARERLGFDIEQVADAIHLKRSVIEALEADDFASLPSQVFVRGYIRSYAKLLGINDEPLLAIHNTHLPQQNLPPETVSVEVKKSKLGMAYEGDPLLFWTMILFISLVTSLALAWWINQGSSAPMPLASITNQTLSDELRNSAPPVQELVQQSSQEKTNISVQLRSAEEQSKSRVVDQVEQSTQQIQTNQTMTPPESVTIKDTLTTDEYTFSLRLKGKSWMEVVDQDNNRILYGLFRPGTIKTFTVNGKLNVFLGNSPVVEVWLNDQLVDHSDYMYANNLARFDINQAGLVSRVVN